MSAGPSTEAGGEPLPRGLEIVVAYLSLDNHGNAEPEGKCKIHGARDCLVAQWAKSVLDGADPLDLAYVHAMEAEAIQILRQTGAETPAG